MKHILIAVSFITYGAGCYTPGIIADAERKAVDMAFEWSSARKFSHVDRLPVAMPARKELVKIDTDVIATLLKGNP